MTQLRKTARGMNASSARSDAYQGFAHADVARLARRQLHLSLAMVGLLALGGVGVNLASWSNPMDAVASTTQATEARPG
jgi:hypothetical protein